MARIPIREALTNQLELRFVIVYNMTHVIRAANIAAARATLLDSLVDTALSLEQSAERWPDLLCDRSAKRGKVVVWPGSGW
jgi:hypothetical protein